MKVDDPDQPGSIWIDISDNLPRTRVDKNVTKSLSLVDKDLEVVAGPVWQVRGSDLMAGIGRHHCIDDGGQVDCSPARQRA